MQDHAQDPLIPKGVKTAGALVGIIVGLVTAFAGIYQIAINLKQMDANIQKDKTASDLAKAREAEEATKKAEIDKQRSAAEAASAERLKNAEIQKEAIARDTLRLGISKEIETRKLDHDFKLGEERRNEIRSESERLDSSLVGVFKGPTVPSLASLTKYAVTGDPRLPNILTSLVAKLDDVHEPSEVNVIFQLFERIGPSALGSVIDSNRNALERYKSNSKRLALFQFNIDRKLLLESLKDSNEPIELSPLFARSMGALMSTQDRDSGLAELQRGHIEDVWDQITRSLRAGASYRTSRPVSRETLQTLELFPGPEAIVDINRDIGLQLVILRQSKRALSRLLRQTQEFVDLAGADLSGLKLLPGRYGVMNFSEAFVAGADFSNAELDSRTLGSLGDAYISREQKVRRNLERLNLRLTTKQVEAINAGA